MGPDRADSGSVRARLGLERPKGEWTDRQTDRWMNRCLETHPCFLQDIGPLELLPRNANQALGQEQ